jgi:N-acetylglutamate synthase-like GNAT family acetyltransferase
MKIEEYRRNNYLISTDKKKIDVAAVHAYLSRSYWAEEIPLKIVTKAIENSLCFAVYKEKKLIGFARVISDYSTFAYLADVYVLEEERGKGLSKWLMECILKHKQLQGLRNFCLLTRDAHSLYAQYGFKSLDKPRNFMAIKKDNFYKKKK